MATSIFELFKIGIGPSSSHTVGPMKCAYLFAMELAKQNLIDRVTRVKTDLFGSLAATGKGHNTDIAVLLGLEGEQPHLVNPAKVNEKIAEIRKYRQLSLYDRKNIPFNEEKDLVFHYTESLPFHPNAMRFTAYEESGESLLEKIYYSIGGGFVLDEEEVIKRQEFGVVEEVKVKYPFTTGQQLLDLCKQHNLSISQIMFENENAWQSEKKTREGLMTIWKAMKDCVKAGISTDGILPGSLKVKRRAKDMYEKLSNRPPESLEGDPLAILDWVNLFALAVNEENAAGGRVVTAPTNGAAGIIPAIIHYYVNYIEGAKEELVPEFLMTAGAICIVFKENSSLSAADVGCQGEVGVACSMAAGALTAVLHGTPEQIENAAEIGMEHNLGLTCDPIAGLVQIPCIERNAMGSAKAINASRLALKGDGSHIVSLDSVIKTMKETGADMSTKYKETARGGLAVNVVEC